MSETRQTLEDAYLAHKRRHGLRDVTSWLRLKLVQAYEEQMRLEARSGVHENWKRIGDLARAQVDQIAPPAIETPREAAE